MPGCARLPPAPPSPRKQAAVSSSISFHPMRLCLPSGALGLCAGGVFIVKIALLTEYLESGMIVPQKRGCRREKMVWCPIFGTSYRRKPYTVRGCTPGRFLFLPRGGWVKLRRFALLLCHIGGCGYRGPVSGAPLFRTVKCCELTQRITRTSTRQPVGEEVVSRKQSAVYKCSRGGSAGSNAGACTGAGGGRTRTPQ